MTQRSEDNYFIRDVKNKDYRFLAHYALPELQAIQDYCMRQKAFIPQEVNVICIKWGSSYTFDDVNRLFHSVCRYTFFHKINFYCFTDDATGLDTEIKSFPLPVMHVEPADNKYAYRKEAGLCDDHLGNLTGQRVFFFDLDSLIVGPLDELFAYPQGNKFYIINDWKHRRGKRANQVGQASCYSYVVGTLGYVKQYFEEHAKAVVKQYYTASQEYLSAKVIEKFGPLNFWPDYWFKSYRFHCMPHPVLRWFKRPQIPKIKGIKMIAFHGLPGIADAIKGIWCSDLADRKCPKGYKKLYKHVRSAPWIQEYWK